MGLFAKETITVDPSVAAVAIGSSSNSKSVGKIQSDLLQTLTPDEQLIALCACERHSNVMAVTNQRILYGSGSHIDYIIEGNRVAEASLMRAPTGNSRQPFWFCASVTWRGNPLKSQRIKNYYLPNDFLAIWRADYDEANALCVRIDHTFGLE
ncbi:MAG: hypothetical protein ACRDP5_14305 [Streptosporangiaceae bacterium]